MASAMQQVSSVFSQTMLNSSYFPTSPRKPPENSISYNRWLEMAPYTALMGVVVSGVQPERHELSQRHRVRSSVGQTNRWRLPESLGFDLLGCSQAVRSISLPYNESIRKIITAESPFNSINADSSKPYKFQQLSNLRTIPSVNSATYRGGNSSMFPLCPSPVKLPEPKPKSSKPIPSYQPPSARPAKPKDVFLYHSKKTQTTKGPDVVLYALHMSWELHRPVLQKSKTLALLLKDAENPMPQQYYKDHKNAETLDSYIARSGIFNNDYKQSLRLSPIEEERRGLDHPAHFSEPRYATMTKLKLDITSKSDPMINKHALAVALGHLYHADVDVDVQDLPSVFAAAHVLKFDLLEDECAKLMMKTMNPKNISLYHNAATSYNDKALADACEKWLALNLVPLLSTQIYLRNLPFDLLERALKSHRLFTYSEFSLYKLVSYWLFLQLNPQVQLFPSYSTVMSYFNSLPKTSALLEREAEVYSPLFQALRLHGVIDSRNIQDMQQMNILPQSWMVKILSSHYNALQGGGDMSLMTNFNAMAVRRGFVLHSDPPYHSEILSLHGFHFELKATRIEDGKYTFWMQRLKPSDPMLSFKECERNTFSLRPDRQVRYSITVQTIKDGHSKIYSTGMLIQQFGLGSKNSCSHVLKLTDFDQPAYVTYSLLYPMS